MKNKETTKQALIDIMNADQKDGLYNHRPHLSICTGCGHFSNKPIGLNNQGVSHLDCCPDKNYVPVTQSPTAVEWLLQELKKSTNYRGLQNIGITHQELFEKAKELERYQKNNLPIHIHEGISNTHVDIVDGIVHVKPNLKTNGK